MATERWSPGSDRSKRMMEAARLLRDRDTDASAACVSEPELFTVVEFRESAKDDSQDELKDDSQDELKDDSKARDRRDRRFRASRICSSCKLNAQCPVRILPVPRHRVRRPTKT